MTITEEDRLAIFASMINIHGEEVARLIMERTPPVAWDQIATKDDVVKALADYATKQDLDELSKTLMAALTELRIEVHAEFGKLRGEMGEEFGKLRGEMGELRGEMGELRGEMGEKLGELRGEMGEKFGELRGEMTLLLASHYSKVLESLNNQTNFIAEQMTTHTRTMYRSLILVVMSMVALLVGSNIFF